MSTITRSTITTKTNSSKSSNASDTTKPEAAPKTAEELKGEDKNTKNQDHTCGCQSQKLTGWAAVEKTLTDFDREEVGGYKEDIDSLLTFAGLYSGVLTAFVIVSFTQLSEDTATESLRVLRIIANQTSGNTVSAPSMLTDPSPFQPSLAAKRVNVLWFASLVISLSTASFSILVKQWLRSYLAFASASPQGALRIRRFRRAGLEAWRVFGIASMLPFLLQISLALFFVGLCFFTADIDPTIGNTTLPLVCAWAFLFIAVTLSPIFSAKCPYKTPAVSPITTTLRRYFWHTLIHWATFLSSASLLFFQRIVRDVTLSILARFDRTRRLRYLVSQSAHGSFSDTLRSRAKALRRVPSEEADIRLRGSEDMAILITADAIQANTEPDMITLEAALKQTNLSWEATVLFFLQIIGNRVPLLPDLTDLDRVQLPTTMIDCSSLSTRARENIVDLFQRYVIDQLPDATYFKFSSSNVLVLDKSDLLMRKWILLVWTMAIHTSLHEEHAQLPEKLLTSVDLAIHDLRRQPESWRVYGHQMALATCCRISHDNFRAGLADKIQSAVDVLSFYSFAVIGASGFIGNPSNPSLLAIAFKDAAQCLVNNLSQEFIETRHRFSETAFEKAITLVVVLCMISQRYQNGGDEIRYENILEPLVIGAFNQRSWRAKRAILNAVIPDTSFDYTFRDEDHIRYCKFLKDSLSHCNVSDGHHDDPAMGVILQFAATPIDETGWKDIIGRAAIVIRLLESYTSGSPDSRPTNSFSESWRRIFFVLTRQMHSLVHFSSAQDFLKLTIDLPVAKPVEGSKLREPQPSGLLKYHCGTKIDKMLSLRSTNEQLQLQHESRQTRSYIPDYFCLTLGRFTDPESRFRTPDGAQIPIWTARHLRNISWKER